MSVRHAVIDDRLAVRIVSERRLRYTKPATVDDRPDHVRSASGLAVLDGKLYVIQDDTSFVAVVAGDEVDAIALPHAPGGRRRFEKALGNKLDKLDLEACVVDRLLTPFGSAARPGGAGACDRDELLAFGSGSLAVVREKICRIRGTHAELVDASALYERMWAAIGCALNIEGAAHVMPPAGELWLFHRGNVGPHDPGPAVVRMSFAEFREYVAGGPVPGELRVDRYDLGAIDGVIFGFTDAATTGDRVFVIAAAEASPDAIEDGFVGGSRIGVIDDRVVRCATLVDVDGRPRKVEGLAFDPQCRERAWITIDPDDVDEPTPLWEIELIGPWW